MNRYAPLLGAALLFSMPACSSTRPAEAAQPAATSATDPTTQPAAPATAPKINPDRAFGYVKEFVAIGSRKPGSTGHQKAIDFIHSRLKQLGVEYDDDKFTAQTPAGKFDLNNIIAKIPGTKDGIVVLVSHFETNYPLPNNFVGANDGGSTTGLMLEIAGVLKSKTGKRDGNTVYLVFDDGEEAFKDWNTNNDNLYGTKHLAQKWQQDGTLRKVKALFVLDMIGDRDLDIQRDSNSTPWLLDVVYQAATKLGYQSHFFQTETSVEDDHLPFQKLGVPVADIIDINYGYGNTFHHSTQDTMDKLSPRSIEIAGNTVLQAIAILDVK